MKKWQVWSEGYRATGEYGFATLHGEFEAETFKDAVIAFKNALVDPYSIRCVDVDNMTFWGCRFFDNEQDARQTFG